MHNEAAPIEVINTLLRRVGEMLLLQRYDDLQAAAPGSRVQSNDLARVIREYGRKIIGIDMQEASIVPLRDGNGWSVWANLRTEEEGKSDLVLIATVVKTSQPPFYKLFIDDVRVP